ncbi:hypothetical protein J5N97_027483 [Dioscorea zingiberensis]|uniref:Nuclear pore complex protein NUP1 n=1 Tax=Dioscorea zingiberensis TaxID=325984 RepID=A0A9D5H7Q6_9LILI|nr:hypothetical protein J5N97_027483 [Dioscorea zingiberensis]
MESAAYEGGGAGGKLRRRPLRRAAAATPYDRPPSSVRGGLGAIRNGWLSRIVDPASRIITGGASRIFSSVFRKPPALPALPAPQPLSEENLQLNEEVPKDICLNSSSEVREKEKSDGNKLIGNSESDGMFELEQLMKKKMFTRAEFDRLTDLLRSRTMESIMTDPTDNNKEVSNIEKEKGAGDTNFYGNISTPKGGLSIPKEESTPAEIAKAYMGSRPSKLSSLRLSSQSHVSREDTDSPSSGPNTVKPPDVSVVPRSIVPFSRVPEQPLNGYSTPRSRGRSAIYRMSRSPYFNVQATNVKGGMPSGDDYIGSSTSSQWTTTNLMDSGGKQALKRGSSVLDNDFGSFGPIRRIRQKSNLMSHPKDIRTSHPGKLLPNASTQLSKDAIPWVTSSIQKHLQFNVPKHGPTDLADAEHCDNRSSDEGIPPIPPQSGEMARRILQQLDKLVPSPKEKSSALKAFVKDESPSKLTLEMLHGRALRSMEHIGPAIFVNAQAKDSVDVTSDDSHSQSLPQKQEIQENGHSKPVVSHCLISESDSRIGAITPAAGAKSDKRVPDFPISGSAAAIPLQEKPSFKISAPEDSLEMEDDDDDDCTIGSAPGQSANGNDKQDFKPELNSVISETQTSEKALASKPHSMPAASTELSVEVDGKTSDRPAGFSFPLTPASSTITQPPTPTMPAPKPEMSAQQKEETLAPVFNFGSKGVPTTTFSLNASGPGGFKSDTNQASELALSFSNTIPSTQAEGINLDTEDNNHKVGEAFKSFGTSVSSVSSASTAPSVFAFGASASPSLNNGSLNPKPSSISGSSIPTSGSHLSFIFSTSSSTTTSSSGISSSSSAAPIFPTAATFKFGSGMTTNGSSSVSSTAEKIKTSGFNFTSTVGTSAANTGSSSSTGSNGSSTSVITSQIPSSTSGSAALTTSAFSSTGTLVAPSLFTSNASGSSAQATSSLFSSTGSSSSTAITLSPPSSTFGSQSLLSPAFPFSTTGSGIFGFGSPAQSSGSNLTSSNTSSQNSTVNFSTTAGPANPIFGAQSTSSASGFSNLSQSTGQLSSFSSTPSFGSSGSASFGFGNSSFGAAASGAKPFSSSSGYTFSASAGSSSGSSSSFASSAASLFNLTSQSSTTPLLGSTFGSSSPSTGLAFGMSAPSGGSTLTFGSSSGSVFFPSAGTASTSTSAQPSFGISPVASFGTGFPQNDQMSVEDSMTDDAVQPTGSTVPTFGQPASSPAAPSFVFGSPAVPSGGQPVFQFGSQNSVPQGTNIFQPAGTLEFNSGGSFSLGSGGGDKSSRKIVRVRRNKPGAKK